MNELRCFGCMKLKKGRPECEHCGYDERLPNAPHQLQPGTVLQNQYVVGRVLGQGGFGITYIGWDSFLEIPVAIKEYYPNTVVTRNATVSASVYLRDAKGTEQYTNNLRRFAKEARSLAKLGAEEDLNRIVRVQNLVQANNTAYIIMEYVAGVDLREHIQRKGRSLTPKETLELLLPLVSALDKVHAHGIIHRDISPDNIMVTHDGRAKLIDFGASHLSQMDDLGHQKSTEAIVKHGFAPMEQYSRKGHLGPWTDVYAMCATLYYCLTGAVLPPVMDRAFYGEEIDWAIVKGLGQGQLQALKDGLTLDTASRIQSMAQLHTRLQTQEEPEIIEEEPEKEPEQVLEPEAEIPEKEAEQAEVSAITATEPVQEEVYTAVLTPEEQKNFGIAPTVPLESEVHTTPVGPEWEEMAVIAATTPVEEEISAIAPTTPVEEEISAIAPTTPVEEELPLSAETPAEEDLPIPGEIPEEQGQEAAQPEIPEEEEQSAEAAEAEVPELPEEEIPEVADEIPEVLEEEIPEVPEEPSGEPEAEQEEAQAEQAEECEEPGAEEEISRLAGEEIAEAVVEEPAEAVVEEPVEAVVEELTEEAALLQPEEPDLPVAVEEPFAEAGSAEEPEIPAKATEAKKKSNVKVWIAAAVAMLACVVGIVLFAKKPEPQAEMAVTTTVSTTVPATEETAPPTTEATQPAPTEPEIDPSLWLDNVLMDTYDGAEYDTYQHNVGKQIYRSQYMNFQIRAAYFLDTLAEEPEDSWDVSAAQDGKVKAWVRKNGERYDLFIAAEGGINGVEACKRMFFGFAYMEEVDFGKAFHTDEATDMSDMFSQCYELKALDVSTFRTGKVTNMAGMFSACQSMTSLDVSSFDTSKVTSMSWMFETCMGLTSLDVTGFDTSKVTDMSWMFMVPGSFGTDCALRELDLSSFTITQATNTEGMFEGRSLTNVNHPQLNAMLPKLAPDTWKENVLMDTYDDVFIGDWNQARGKTVYRSQIRNNQVRSVTFLDTLAQEPQDSWDVSSGRDGRVKAWSEKNGELYDLYIAAEGGINGKNSCKGMFQCFEWLEEVHFGDAFHTDEVQYMDLMFYRCRGLRKVDVSSLNTSNVTSMSNMFNYCLCLGSLDVSGFDTSAVTNMSYMFQNCSGLRQLDVSGFDTSAVTDMAYMFQNCFGLRQLDVSGFDTGNVTNMNHMFSGCNQLTALDVSGIDTGNVADMSAMFEWNNNLKSLDVSGFDTTGLTNCTGMFSGCRRLETLDLSNFRYDGVATGDMFKDCDKLVDVNHPDYNQLLG